MDITSNEIKVLAPSPNLIKMEETNYYNRKGSLDKTKERKKSVKERANMINKQIEQFDMEKQLAGIISVARRLNKLGRLNPIDPVDKKTEAKENTIKTMLQEVQDMLDLYESDLSMRPQANKLENTNEFTILAGAKNSILSESHTAVEILPNKKCLSISSNSTSYLATQRTSNYNSLDSARNKQANAIDYSTRASQHGDILESNFSKNLILGRSEVEYVGGLDCLEYSLNLNTHVNALLQNILRQEEIALPCELDRRDLRESPRNEALSDLAFYKACSQGSMCAERLALETAQGFHKNLNCAFGASRTYHSELLQIILFSLMEAACRHHRNDLIISKGTFNETILDEASEISYSKVMILLGLDNQGIKDRIIEFLSTCNSKEIQTALFKWETKVKNTKSLLKNISAICSNYINQNAIASNGVELHNLTEDIKLNQRLCSEQPTDQGTIAYTLTKDQRIDYLQHLIKYSSDFKTIVLKAESKQANAPEMKQAVYSIINSQVKAVELQSIDLRRSSDQALCLLISCGGIQRLQLTHCELDDQAFQSIAKALKHNCKITTLGICSSGLSAKACLSLRDCLVANTCIATLLLPNSIPCGKIELLLNCLLEVPNSLTGIDISRNKLTKEDFQALLYFVVKSIQLKSLNLSGIRLKDRNIEDLGRALSLNRGLTSLVLDSIGLNESNICTLARSLCGLEELSLRDNPIGEPGGVLLANTIKRSSFRRVYLDRCRLTGNALMCLGDAVIQRGGFELVSLSGNKFDFESVQKIRSLMEKGGLGPSIIKGI